jgi:hypothetical protein
MAESFPRQIRLEMADRPSETVSGLLVTVVAKANEIGFFETLSEGLDLKMKVCTYSHRNKIQTIVAGLAVGCRHVAEMQTKLVPDMAAAGLFEMARFPDQAQINAFLRRCGPEQVAHLGRAHQRLLLANSTAAERAKWLPLADGRRVLPVDLDQTPLVTRSKRASGTAAGYFGRKRGNVGYKKSVAILGADIREVLWLRLEPGNTHGQEAVPVVLQQLAALSEAKGLKAGEVLLRGDSQYGSTGVLRQVRAAGHHYLLKGYTPETAKHLANNLPVTAVWTYRGQDSNGSWLWLTDAGEVELRGHDDPADMPAVRSRAVLLVRVGQRVHRKRGRGSPQTWAETAVSYEHYLTDLGAEVLPVEMVLDVYNARETVESFFRAEQDAFGAQYLRTHKGDGEGAFLWLLASTVNLLRWLQRTTFAQTPLEDVGLTKLVTQAMRIAATVVRTAQAWIIILPGKARLIRQLVNAWYQRAWQLPLPLGLDGQSP